jgi:hypothetical protein
MVGDKIKMVLIDAPDGVVITEEKSVYEKKTDKNFLEGRLEILDKYYTPNF